MDNTECLQCGRRIKPAEQRYTWGSGWICVDCGLGVREPDADVYIGRDFTTPVIAAPVATPKQQWRLLVSLSAAVLLLPLTAGVIVYLMSPGPDTGIGTLAVADDQPVSDLVLREYEQAVSLASARGTTRDYAGALDKIAHARQLLTRHPHLQPHVTGADLEQLQRGYESLLAQARLPVMSTGGGATAAVTAPRASDSTSAAPNATAPDAAADRAIAAALAPPLAVPTPPPAPAPSAPQPTDAPTPPQPAPLQPAPPMAAVPPSEPSQLPPQASTPPADDERSAADLFADLGSDRLASGDLSGAMKYYADSLRAKPGNERATVGRAIVLYLRGDNATAISILEGVNRLKSTRLSAQNLASMYFLRTPLRSARIMHDHLRSSNQLDPEAFDYYVLGMWKAQWGTVKTGFYWHMTDFYDIYEQQLRLARVQSGEGSPDDRRWGNEWITPEEFEQKMEALARARSYMFLEYERLQSAQRANRKLTAAQATARVEAKRNATSNAQEKKTTDPAVNYSFATQAIRDKVDMEKQVALARYVAEEAKRSLNHAAPPMPTDIPFLLP